VPTLTSAHGDGPEDDNYYESLTACVDGVPMQNLSKAERLSLLPELRRYIMQLKTLRSDIAGGPSRILRPPDIVSWTSRNSNVTWKQIKAQGENFVFCPGDLQCSNVVFNPQTLKITTILDWDYAGYYPKEHEIPFLEKKAPSGNQVKDFPHVVEQMKKFWARELLNVEDM